MMVINVVRIWAALESLCVVSSPRFGLLQVESLWLESEDADVLSVELDLTEWTDGTDARGGVGLGLAMTPTDAELLPSGWQQHTQVT